MDIEGPSSESGPPKKEAARTAFLLEAARAAARSARARRRAIPSTIAADVVLTYLLRECYADTAAALLREAGARSDANGDGSAEHFADIARAGQAQDVFQRLERRRAVRKLVREGRIAEAMPAADALLGRSISVLHPKLHFDLCCQHYVELVRGRQFDEACTYSQRALAPLAQNNEDFMAALKDYLALLAYTDPEKTMLKHLMQTDRRDRLAERLSGCLFEREVLDLGGEEAWECGTLEQVVRQFKVVKKHLTKVSASAGKTLIDVQLQEESREDERRIESEGEEHRAHSDEVVVMED